MAGSAAFSSVDRLTSGRRGLLAGFAVRVGGGPVTLHDASAVCGLSCGALAMPPTFSGNHREVVGAQRQAGIEMGELDLGEAVCVAVLVIIKRAGVLVVDDVVVGVGGVPAFVELAAVERTGPVSLVKMLWSR
jgi:hypothetical protein